MRKQKPTVKRKNISIIEKEKQRRDYENIHKNR
jgi:hypothetical protein